MFPYVDIGAVENFNRTAPTVESTVIGGVTIEVFYDYWHGRPAFTGGTPGASVGYRVAGAPHAWFHHVAAPGSRDGDCNGPTQHSPKVWKRRLDYAAWLRWQVEVERRLLRCSPFYHELNIKEAESIEAKAARSAGRSAVRSGPWSGGE